MNCNNGNQAVQDHIGDAYDVVLAVYNLLDPISAVHANATNIQEILDNLGVISAVGGKMPAVLNISSNMDDLLDIHSLLPMLEIMNTNRQDYIDAGNLSGAIHKILSIRSQLNQISARITGGIFKGEKGDKGDTGDTGETGAIGLTGEAGSDGDNLSLMPSVANIGNLPLTDDVGTLRVVRNNSHIYKWTGTAPWLDLGLFANGQRGVSLVGRDRAIHLGDLPLAVDGAQDGDVRVVYEDGHQYTYHADSDSWTDMGQFLIQFKEWVADVDALPVGNNAHHDVRGTENDGKLYAWDDVDADWRYLGNLLGGLKMFNMQLPVATVADLPDPVEINTAFYVIKSGEIWVYEKVEYPVSGVTYGSGDVIPSVDEWVNKGLWQRGYKVADFNISDDGIVSLKEHFSFDNADFIVDANHKVKLKNKKTFLPADFVDTNDVISIRDKKTYKGADFTDIGNEIAIRNKKTFETADFVDTSNHITIKNKKTFKPADFTDTGNEIALKDKKSFSPIDFVDTGNVITFRDRKTYKASDFTVIGNEVAIKDKLSFHPTDFSTTGNIVKFLNRKTYRSVDFAVVGNEVRFKNRKTYKASDFVVSGNEVRLRNSFRATDFEIIGDEIRFKNRKTYKPADFNIVGNEVQIKDKKTFKAGHFIVVGNEVRLTAPPTAGVTYRPIDFEVVANELRFKNRKTYKSTQFDVVSNEVRLKNVKTYKSGHFTVVGNEVRLTNPPQVLTYRAVDFEIVGGELRFKNRKTYKSSDFDVVSNEVRIKDKKSFNPADFNIVGNVVSIKPVAASGSANTFQAGQFNVSGGGLVTLTHPYTFAAADFNVSGSDHVTLKQKHTFNPAHFTMTSGGYVSLVAPGGGGTSNTFENADFTVTGAHVKLKNKKTFRFSDFSIVSNEVRARPVSKPVLTDAFRAGYNFSTTSGTGYNINNSSTMVWTGAIYRSSFTSDTRYNALMLNAECGAALSRNGTAGALGTMTVAGDIRVKGGSGFSRKRGNTVTVHPTTGQVMSRRNKTYLVPFDASGKVTLELWVKDFPAADASVQAMYITAIVDPISVEVVEL